MGMQQSLTAFATVLFKYNLLIQVAGEIPSYTNKKDYSEKFKYIT